jgi:hypothetical protein
MTTPQPQQLLVRATTTVPRFPRGTAHSPRSRPAERRHRSAAPRREAQPHPQHPARERRAAVGAPRHRPCANAPLRRLLYETAARADEVLRPDVEKLDIPAKRAHALEGPRCRPAVLRLGQRAAAATPDRRPPRRSGVPIQPSPGPPRAPAAGDICPLTGRARLSYRRATSCSSRRRAGRASVPSLRAHAPGPGHVQLRRRAGTSRLHPEPEKPQRSGEVPKRMMGLEPTTFCMASRRSSQLSYIRASRRV